MNTRSKSEHPKPVAGYSRRTIADISRLMSESSVVTLELPVNPITFGKRKSLQTYLRQPAGQQLIERMRRLAQELSSRRVRFLPEQGKRRIFADLQLKPLPDSRTAPRMTLSVEHPGPFAQ